MKPNAQRFNKIEREFKSLIWNNNIVAAYNKIERLTGERQICSINLLRKKQKDSSGSFIGGYDSYATIPFYSFCLIILSYNVVVKTCM